MADAPNPQPKTGGLPVLMLATIGAGAYIAGRFSRKEGESPLPSLGALAMTYVVFRGLDMLWPSAVDVVKTTLPFNVDGAVGGIAQAFRNQAPLSSGPLSFYSPRNATVDGYSVK